MKKGRITMAQIYEDCAAILRGDRDAATRTTVRCYCNEIMDGYAREGFTVNFNYSQERAYHAVRALL